MAFTALFSLVPLAVSALISPGRRLREIGIVLVVAAGWTGAAAASFAILAIDPKFMALMPPDTRDTLASFDDPAFGAALTIAMGGLGLWADKAERRRERGIRFAGTCGVREARAAGIATSRATHERKAPTRRQASGPS